jgi:hypothetical protein
MAQCSYIASKSGETGHAVLSDVLMCLYTVGLLGESDRQTDKQTQSEMPAWPVSLSL